MKPLVSVIIPVYNGERHLAPAISSVLTQSYRPFEIIVIDDGSSDNSVAVARSFAQVRVECRPHASAAAARNTGVALARGEILAFLDADDLWLPEKLSLQVAALSDAPQMCFTLVDEFLDADAEAGSVRPPTKGATGYIPSTLLLSQESFRQVGPFNQERPLAEFFEWFANARQEGLQTVVLPQVLVQRRLHATNSNRREREKQIEYVRVAKALLDSRRQASQDKKSL